MSVDLVLYARLTGIVAGFSLAGYLDVKSREVTDQVWIGMASLGAVLLVLSDYSSGADTIFVNVVAIVFVMEHFVPWENVLGEHEELAIPLEAIVYLLVVVFAVYGYFFDPALVNVQFLAIIISVLMARAMFESKLLYGGADAKALIAASLLLPILFSPLPVLIHYPAFYTTTVLAYIPFPFTMLIDGALLTLVVPIGILLRNLKNGYKEMPDAFFLYEIPTGELPSHFVWLRRPLPQASEDVETAEEDHQMRVNEAKRLLSEGVNTVYVTPQLPMVAALAGGAILAILFGNLLFLVF